ncbi:protein serine/threonine phosphatase 2C [Amylostereum chailletii]|nr:protein serine/threonine phosphatase 2C [Amylostereum chailletii]
MHEFRSQDRYCTESWPVHGGAWIFNAVFDGHVGHATVEHALRSIPPSIRRALDAHLHAHRGTFSPDAVSAILSDAITRFDSSLVDDFVSLFPGGAAGLQRMSDEHIRQLFLDRSVGAQNSASAVRCLHGTTALLSLTDPSREHLWIANVGDCQAVLGSRDAHGQWTTRFMTALHDGDNPSELSRIQAEHPGERDCCRDNRVIGFLGPTRTLGDAWLKMPAVFSQRVLLNFRREWNVDRPETYISRVRTPPYVSSVPDVHHLPLPRPAPGRSRDMFLLMCSDGLPDLYQGRGRADMVSHWVRTIGRAWRSGAHDNLALALLRNALGGEDIRSVSQHLTVEMEERWMDDVTVLVQRL